MTTMRDDFSAMQGNSRAASLRTRLVGLPLHYRFALAGSLVTLIGMAVIGSIVSSSIETGVVRNSAISSAVYMESLVAPMSQELVRSATLSAETIERMNDLLDRKSVV